MNKEQERTVMLSLIRSLRENGSWCGETHIQKAAYFLKTVTAVPLKFEFILYKHGPFSFDLRDELTAMRAYGMLDIEVEYPYGPRLRVTSLGNAVCQRYPKTMAKFGRQVSFVAETLGSKGVVELERLATALFVRQSNAGASVEQRAVEINDVKPHITVNVAREAVKAIDRILSEADTLGNLTSE